MNAYGTGMNGMNTAGDPLANKNASGTLPNGDYYGNGIDGYGLYDPTGKFIRPLNPDDNPYEKGDSQYGYAIGSDQAEADRDALSDEYSDEADQKAMQALDKRKAPRRTKATAGVRGATTSTPSGSRTTGHVDTSSMSVGNNIDSVLQNGKATRALNSNVMNRQGSNSSSRGTLPQTGERTPDAAIIAAIMAGLSGLAGLAYSDKRKRE